MEIAKLIYKISDQLEFKDTQELFLDLELADEAKHETRTKQLTLEISNELRELQTRLDDKENISNIIDIFETISVSLESIYLNTDLDLTTLEKNSKGTEISDNIKELISKKAA